jgi:hypothetical protein
MSNAETYVATLGHLLEDALNAMNQAVSITAERGPTAAIESIADYLNDTDAVDETIADRLPADWLTRWGAE